MSAYKGQLGLPIKIRVRPKLRVIDSKPKPKKTRTAKLVAQALMEFPTGHHPTQVYHLKPKPPTNTKGL